MTSCDVHPQAPEHTHCPTCGSPVWPEDAGHTCPPGFHSEATNEAMEYGEECEEECAPEVTPEEVAAYARDEALGDEHNPEFAEIAAKAAADRRRSRW